MRKQMIHKNYVHVTSKFIKQQPNTALYITLEIWETLASIMLYIVMKSVLVTGLFVDDIDDGMNMGYME